MPRTDAHIHLFNPGYVESWPASCRRVTPSEVILYDEMTRLYDIDAALVVGYEGESWATGNNDYIAHLAQSYSWIQPVAFIHDPRTLTTARLEQLADQGFLGISLYLFAQAHDDPDDNDASASLSVVDVAVWQWLEEHCWLISVNSQGELWRRWEAVLARHPNLRVLIAHLGLPPRCTPATDPDTMQANLESVLALQAAPHVYVKLSGLYALTEPVHAYPHAAAWPYIRLLFDSYGAQRLLWGSDFTPALESLSFPQSVHGLENLPFLGPPELDAIYHRNLAKLLADVDRRATSAARRPAAEENQP